MVLEAGGDVRGSEWYKRVGREGGERSLMMETTAHILLLCCIGIIQSNMMRDGWLSHVVLLDSMFANKVSLEKNYLLQEKRLSDYNSVPGLFTREERQQKHNYFRSVVSQDILQF